MSQKYLYQIVNIPWVNSTVDVWHEDTPEQKHRLRVLGFQQPSGCATCRLKSVMVQQGLVLLEDEITFERVE